MCLAYGKLAADSLAALGVGRGGAPSDKSRPRARRVLPPVVVQPAMPVSAVAEPVSPNRGIMAELRRRSQCSRRPDRQGNPHTGESRMLAPVRPRT